MFRFIYYSLAIVLVGIQSSQAHAFGTFDPESWRLSREAQVLGAQAYNAWFQALPARQQRIVSQVQKIESDYMRETGSYAIPYTQQNVMIVAREVGARNQEDIGLVSEIMLRHAESAKQLDHLEMAIKQGMENSFRILGIPPGMW